MNKPNISALITLLRLDQTITSKQKLLLLYPKAAGGNFMQNIMTCEKEYRKTMLYAGGYPTVCLMQLLDRSNQLVFLDHLYCLVLGVQSF